MSFRNTRSLVAASILLAAPLTSTPAQAASFDTDEMFKLTGSVLYLPPSQDPGTAATLSLLAPVVCTWAVLGTNVALLTSGIAVPNQFNQTALTFLPLSFSAGYWYAGVPKEGLANGIVGMAIPLAGFGYLNALMGQNPPAAASQELLVNGLVVAGLLGYGGWIAYDVARVTQAQKHLGPFYRPAE